MKKKKRLIVVLTACMFVFLYSGCQRKDIVKPQNITKAKNIIDDVVRAKPSVGVFSSAAENADEFFLSRGRKPKWWERPDINTTKRMLNPLELAARGVVASGDRSKQGFMDFVESTEEQLIIVIGHNDTGLFYFADGSSLPLKEMASLITRKGKRYCFLSCVARKYVSGPAVEIPITPVEAADIMSDVNRLLEQRQQQAVERILGRGWQNFGKVKLVEQDSLLKVKQMEQESLLYVEAQDDLETVLQRQINTSIKKAKRQQKIKYIVAGGGPGGGMVVVKLVDKTILNNRVSLLITQQHKD